MDGCESFEFWMGCRAIAVSVSQHEYRSYLSGRKDHMTSLLLHELLPPLAVSHIDCGIGVKDKATFLPLFVEIESHARLLGLAHAESGAFDLRCRVCDQLRASSSVSELPCGQSDRNRNRLETCGSSSGARQRSWLTHGGILRGHTATGTVVQFLRS